MSQQDKDRYTKQQKTVSKIVAIFEEKDYSDENPEIGLKVMSLMNEVGFSPNHVPGMEMLSLRGIDARARRPANRNHGRASTGDDAGTRWAPTASSRLPHNVIYSFDFTRCIYDLDTWEGDTKLLLALE